jgi:penicillin-binding protein 2
MKNRALLFFQFFLLFVAFTGIILASTGAQNSASKKKRKKHAVKPVATAVSKPMTGKVVASSSSRKFRPTVAASSKTFRPRVRRVAYSPWDEPTFADSTLGDNVDGEDLGVRRAAVESLGPLNGSVVVSDPGTGRILAMVNQKLAGGNGFQPCSTIKVPVAFAALSEGIIERDTMVRIYGRTKMSLTTALAKSNNQYFAKLGEQLGYEKMSYYAHLFGLGEKAGLDIPGEQAGHFPSEPPKNGGMGMLTSFGEEISLTPLQLSSIMVAIANGGTMYYLQHPRSQEDITNFVPRIKRKLEIENQIPEVQPGMRGAVQFGTARRILALTEDPIMGKTGTCSEGRTHLGWFGSFGEVNGKKLSVSVLLTGGRPSIGPAAAGVAGGVYKRLSEQNYAVAVSSPALPASMLTQTTTAHPASGY